MAGFRRAVFLACSIAISLCLAGVARAQPAPQKSTSDDAIANSLFNLGMPKTWPAERPEEKPIVLHDADLQTMVARAYNFSRTSVTGDALRDKTQHNVIIEPGVEGMAKAMQDFRERLVDGFQIKVAKETRETQALVLKPPVATGEGLHEHTGKTAPHEEERGHTMEMSNITPAVFAIFLEDQMHVVVIDETGLKGRYDFRFHAPSKPDELPEAIEQQLGLGAVWKKRPVDYLMVTKR